MDALPRVLAGIEAVAPRRLHRTSSSTPSSRAATTTMSSWSWWSSRARSTPRSGSSNTWTSAARRSGGPRPSSRAREMLARLAEHFGADRARSSKRRPRRPRASGCRTARRSASSRRRPQPFCRTCDRARLTADGVLLLCLYAQHGTDLRRPLRAGASRDTLLNLIRAVWAGRADRGAEERLRRARPRRLHSRQRAEARRASGNAHARRLAERAHRQSADRPNRRALPDQRGEDRPPHRAVPGQ